MVWALVIAILVLAIAYFIYKVGSEVLEVEGSFFYVCGAFLILFVAAAIGLKFLIPVPGAADISTIPKAWMAPAYAAQ
ncbi:hypothetical protein K8R04_01565 [Candidatus Uhrbacteria bacterium]|nr:hypothetical protein [Candidatus Uhrbacteria bacterium]